MNKYNTLNHGKYLTQYHIVWCPKFRYSILKDDIKLSLNDILVNICNKYNYGILELEIMEDHIHIFINTKPTVAPVDAIRTLKSITAIELFKKYPELKKFYSKCGSLWGKGYFLSTIGNVSAESIKKYIQEQSQQK